MLSSMSSWADANRGIALDVVRIYLGLGLLLRGVQFLADPASYTDLLPGGADSAFASLALMHYVGLSHVAGGLFLSLGLLTRVAALVQVPILTGAALLVHLPTTGLFSQSFAFAAFVAVLLAVLSVWGAGPWSLDHAIRGWSARQADTENALIADHARELRSRPRPSALAGERSAAPSAADGEPACTHGRDRTHPRVRAERDYAGLSGLRFLTGTHPLPSTVTFVCRDCKGIVETVTDPDALEALRYESTG